MDVEEIGIFELEITMGLVPCLIRVFTRPHESADVYIVADDGHVLHPIAGASGASLAPFIATTDADALSQAIDFLTAQFGPRTGEANWTPHALAPRVLGAPVTPDSVRDGAVIALRAASRPAIRRHALKATIRMTDGLVHASPAADGIADSFCG